MEEKWCEYISRNAGSWIPQYVLVNAPISPGAAFVIPTCVDQQVTWIENCIKHVISEGNAIEPSKSEQEWGKHHDEVAESTLVHKTDSWYTGTNVKVKQEGLFPLRRCERI